MAKTHLKAPVKVYGERDNSFRRRILLYVLKLNGAMYIDDIVEEYREFSNVDLVTKETVVRDLKFLLRGNLVTFKKDSDDARFKVWKVK